MFALSGGLTSVTSCMSKIGVVIGSFIVGAISGGLVVHFSTSNRITAGEKSVAGESHQRVEGRRNEGGQNKAETQNSFSRLQSQIVQLEGVQEMQGEDEAKEFVVIPSALLKSFAGNAGSADIHASLFADDADVEKLLNISDQEKAQLQNNWRAMQRKLKKVELANAEIGETADGSVTITLPSMTDQMLEIGDEFKSSIGGVLGENRGKAFSAIKQLDSAFVNEEPTSYSVKMESTGDGFWRYHIKQQGGQGNKAWVGSKVPHRLRHLTEAANIVGELEVKEDDPED